jgi:hypothetical protein
MFPLPVVSGLEDVEFPLFWVVSYRVVVKFAFWFVDVETCDEVLVELGVESVFFVVVFAVVLVF